MLASHVHSDDMLAIYILIAVVIALIVGISWYASPANQIKRKLRDAVTFRIAEMRDGTEGRVIGKARVLTDQLLAPLSGRTCVYYIARVEQYISTGRSGHWK